MKRNKRLALILAMAFVLLIMPVFGGCNLFGSDNGERCTVWEYRFNTNRDGVRIISLLDNSILTEDNILHIPTSINGYRIAGFGWHPPQRLPVYFNPGTQVEKIVIPEGMFVSGFFWGQNVPSPVEFLSSDPSTIQFRTSFDGGSWRIRRVIVPDGTYEQFSEAVGSGPFIVVEKSDFLEQQNEKS